MSQLKMFSQAYVITEKCISYKKFIRPYTLYFTFNQVMLPTATFIFVLIHVNKRGAWLDFFVNVEQKS